MRKLLRADLFRLFCKPWLWLCVCAMAALALALLTIQYTAMGYAVSIDRVIFLPMAFYGIIAGALVSMYVGEDYADGVIVTKIISGKSRGTVYLSAQLASWLGCLIVYSVMTMMTIGVGVNLFDINVTAGQILKYFLLGILTCLAYGSIFCMISMTVGNRSRSVVICMTVAFGMLFLCLHSNQVIIQTEPIQSVQNLAHIGSIKRVLYEYLHDINPTGQAAQLSAMNCLNATRFILIDILWIGVSVKFGSLLFNRKDIR